jgi:hypothetical protein
MSMIYAVKECVEIMKNKYKNTVVPDTLCNIRFLK